jgi:speckle-type POZ protein
VQEAMVASGFKIQVPPSDLSENLGKLLTGAVGGCNRQCIMIEDIQPAIFKAMLDFIYTDSLPAMDALDADEKDAMVKHLLVAADKYAVERMKLMCASILCERLDEETGHYVGSC